MTYPETIAFLFSQLPMYQRKGKAAYKADLSNTIAICSRLDNPENKFKSVHVAGTNGKGSTSHYIASMLQEAGFKVGLYTSPHLVDFRERIRINGEMIPEQFVVDFVETKQNVMDGIHPSFFEWTVGLAFTYFTDQNVDIAIIETGLGGRLDSTNVINPLVSVITNIGLDHTQFLGDTMDKVAAEKAGIIKLKTPVLIGETQESIQHVFTEKAQSLDAPISFADQQSKILNTEQLVNYQKKNVQTASQLILKLGEFGFSVSISQMQRGVDNMKGNTGLRGRWDVLQQKPLVVVDTAHNIEGLTYAMAQVANEDYSKLRIVFGMVNDKSPEAVLKLLPKGAEYYLCAPSIERAFPIDELENIFKKSGFSTSNYSSVKKALSAAITDSQDDDMVYVGGSTFVVADVF